MFGLVQLVPKRPDVAIDRLWLIFFGKAKDSRWWTRLLTPGYEHVSACAWFDDQQRWVYYNPTSTGTVVLLYRDDEFGPRLTQMLDNATEVLRVRSTMSRRHAPFGWWCTGAIKALVGFRSCALLPRQLRNDLLRHGAESVSVPRRSGAFDGQSI